MSLFITVGSTGFDELIRETTIPEFLTSLTAIGIKKVRFQYGSSESIFTNNISKYVGPILDIDGYGYKSSITKDMEEADIVVSHAGSGTILQALRMESKKLIVVVNVSLMDNHQHQLAEAMAAKKYLLCSDPSTIAATIQSVHGTRITPFPKADTKIFAHIIDEQMRF